MVGRAMNGIAYRVYCILHGGWRRRYTIVIPILIFPIIGLLVGISSPKHYKAHTSMLIQETAKMNPFLEDFAVSSMLKERVDALNTLLHSRHILQAVALELELINSDTSDTQRDSIVAQLSSSLTMKMIGKDLIRIDHTASDAEKMEAFLQSVTIHFIEQLLAPERSSITDSAIFLNEHLERRRADLDIAEQALSDFKSEHAEALPELHSMNITRLNQLRQSLAEHEAEFAGAVKNVSGIKQLLSQTNPVIAKLEEAIVENRSNLALLRARYTDRHSKVQAVKRTLRRLEAERVNTIEVTERIVDEDTLWNIAISRQNRAAQNNNQEQNSTDNPDAHPILISQLTNLLTAKRKADGLDDNISRLKSLILNLKKNVNSFGDKENQLIRLQRDLKVKRDIYEELLQRYEMAKVTGSLGRFEQAKRVKIIDRPFTPTAPNNIHFIVFFIAGIFGGLFLGCGFAVVLELCDTTVRYRSTLENITQVPIISRIPCIKESVFFSETETFQESTIRGSTV